MTDVERLLAAELDELGRRAPHDADLAGAVRRRARRQAAVVASALAVVLLAGVAAVVAVRLRPAAAPAASTPPDASQAGCGVVQRGPLPEWARTGFSSADPGIPFVRSRNGDMVAILFGYPLTAPPRDDVNNKILWVDRPLPIGAVPPESRDSGFLFEARLAGSDLRVRREVAPAPGPSIVDLPAAGCWQLSLRWANRSDTISLRYEPRSGTR